jgi:hypothetical protein
LPFQLVQALAPCQFPIIMHQDEEIYTILMQILVQAKYMAETRKTNIEECNSEK